MNIFSKNYISKIFGFSNEFEGIDMNFKDKNLEDNYFLSNKQIYHQKSKLFSLVCFLTYVFIFIYSLLKNNFFFARSLYCVLAGFIIDILLLIISNLCHYNLNLLKAFTNIRFIILYINIATVIMFPAVIPDFTQCNQLRFIYTFLLFMNVLYVFYLDFNFLMLILVPILNSGFILFFQFYYSYKAYFFVYELIGNLIYYFVSFLLKKYDFGNKKEKFFEFYKNEHYIENII